jgi:hypothetical protein
MVWFLVSQMFSTLVSLVQIGRMAETDKDPETVFRWYRDLVRRKWTQENKGKRSRPRIDVQVENLIMRLAKENLHWGYYKIE